MFFAANLFSQDTIVVFDGGAYIGKVLEISQTAVKFQRLDTKKQEICVRDKRIIAYIKYSNGTKEIINEKRKDIEIKKSKLNPIYVKKPPLRSPIDTLGYKKHRLSFSVNLLAALIDDASINIDYLYNYRHSAGIAVGIIHPNNMVINFREGFNTVDEDLNPGGIWHGTVLKLNYKFYFHRQRREYVGLELLYRSLGYSNENLVSKEKYTDNISQYNFIRSEYTNEYGVNIQYGIHLLPTNKSVNLEAFGALGVRDRYRNYTTFTSKHSGTWSGGTNQPIGVFSITQFYPLVSFGLKIGINTFFK